MQPICLTAIYKIVDLAYGEFMKIPDGLKAQIETTLSALSTEGERADLLYDITTIFYDDAKWSVNPKGSGPAAESRARVEVGKIRDAAGTYAQTANS